MYDIRQFRPVLYVLVTMGFIGFAMAAQSPALFVLGVGAVAVNAWLVATNRFSAMPRLVANGITLLAFLFVGQQVMGLRTTPIVLVGQFLVFLQVVKLYEQRANRDYAQLLVLSLLLMVAAAITTASLLFGVLFIAYLFLSLYCCLLFHLKVETDLARASYPLPEDKISPGLLKQDQRYLSRSMRRLTGLVSTFAITTAVVVFLVFPRGTGANLLGPLQLKAGQTLTGFSDQMSFQQIANITQNTEVVAYVKVWKDDKPVEGTRAIYLRGNTLDRYEGSVETGWQWQRTRGRMGGFGPGGFGSVGLGSGGPGGPQGQVSDEQIVTPRVVPPGEPVYRQHVRLMPTGTQTLFAMPFPVKFTPARPIRVRYVARDELLLATDPIVQPIEYEVESSDAAQPVSPQQMVALAPRPMVAFQSTIDPRVRQYVDRVDIGDLLADRRQGEAAKAGWAPHAMDEEIARRIERHLQTEFAYTLDLTEFGLTHNEDPIVRFLYDFKRGHCEYFAGAMTLLCQSLDIRSRVVIGFKCDEYTGLGGGLYTVRQSHAHAWVEVMTPDGWKTFDPTSGREFSAARGGIASRMRGLFNYLEYTWANSVIAYDNDNRDNLITNVDTQLSKTAVNSSQKVGRAIEWAQRLIDVFASRVVGPIVVLLVGGLCFAVAWFVWERWRLRRRAERIGLDILPTTDQLRLVRQLGFYDDLLRLLERHNMTRPPHLTPKEFADSLAFLPSGTYDTIRRLTHIFYKIRFGRTKLTGPQQRRLHTVLQQLSQSLGPAGQ